MFNKSGSHQDVFKIADHYIDNIKNVFMVINHYLWKGEFIMFDLDKSEDDFLVI